MLMKKVDTLMKVIEVESKKAKREAAAKEKEAVCVRVEPTKKDGSMKSSRR
uniref:Uncharacterized protein n=1 Tax=Rhizophora mucronata TaxID=61149 RepID=A0A2P2PX42_RHIMU